jgi:hypothetical protein
LTINPPAVVSTPNLKNKTETEMQTATDHQ